MKEKLLKALENFENKKVLVAGDVMLDKFIWGNVERISPEAPVQVVDVVKEEYNPGGAGNTANNISTLSGNVIITGLIGEDIISNTLVSEFKKRGISSEGLIVDKTRPTIQKIRIMGQNQQLLRVDYEKRHKIEKGVEEKLIEFVYKTVGDIDVVVISDYAKGVVTENLVKKIIEYSKKYDKIVVVDPKPANGSLYKGVTLITPNKKEAEAMAGIEINTDADVINAGNTLVKELNCNVLITRGAEGMSLFENNGSAIKVTHIPTNAKQVYDVSGAGDTVVASMALGLACGLNLKEAAILANYAAGIVVGKVGVATVTVDEIKEVLK